ncbi:zinc transporter ZIP3-like [Onthophagus taurus]|uniref:zinc transporter ZIP3-like n=1 Tax=Onthophagus taurus TaxID=166361 RepID=UPI000C202A53|nr:zinc transporter ZIP3-like [Onthophagus taurus]
MDLIATKIAVAVIFAFIRVFFGLLPIKIYKILKIWEKEDEGAAFINERRHKQVNCSLAIFQSFGGGVLFATCFLHMIPEVNKSVQFLCKDNGMGTSYPFAQVIVSTGFFLVYFVEEISHWLITRMGRETRKSIQCKRNSCSQSLKENKIHPGEINGTPERVYIIDPSPKKSPPTSASIVSEKNKRNLKIDLELDDISKNTFLEDDETAEEEKQLEKLLVKQEKNQQQVLRCCLVILALSLHGFFEGLAIGLQVSISNIWYLSTAISIHSATILFCVGLELLIARTKMKIIVLNVFILSSTSPFGVLLGLVITLYADMNTTAKSLAVVLLEGLSAGTILYITFFEVLNREKERRVIILTRACFILTGFTLMAILEYVELGK